MTKTPNINLNVPDYQDERWDIPVNENWNLLDTAIAGKQTTLTFDSTPTSGSSNPVTSDGLYLALLGKANDADVVKLAGDQTVAGIKTFTDTLVINNTGIGNGTLTIKNSVTTYGTSAVDLVTATSNGYNQFLLHFQEGNKWCTSWNQDPTSKNISLYFTGCEAVYAPTPTSADNSTKIATTAYFRNNMQVVTALPASPTVGVFYFVKE